MITRIIVAGLGHVKDIPFRIRERGIDPAEASRIFRGQTIQRGDKSGFFIAVRKRGDLSFKGCLVGVVVCRQRIAFQRNLRLAYPFRAAEAHGIETRIFRQGIAYVLILQARPLIRRIVIACLGTRVNLPIKKRQIGLALFRGVHDQGNQREHLLKARAFVVRKNKFGRELRVIPVCVRQPDRNVIILGHAVTDPGIILVRPLINRIVIPGLGTIKIPAGIQRRFCLSFLGGIRDQSNKGRDIALAQPDRMSKDHFG